MAKIVHEIYRIEDKLEALQPLLDSIQYVEDANTDEVVLRSAEIIGNIIYSMRCSKEYNFFSLVMDYVDMHFDCTLKAPAGVNYHKNHYILKINPLMLMKFDKFMIRAILIHETYHIILKHVLRDRKYDNCKLIDKERINIAEDVAINQHIPELENNKNCCNLHTLAQMLNISYYDIRPNREFEYYAELIMQYAPVSDIENMINSMINTVLSGIKHTIQISTGQGEGDNSDSNEDDNNSSGKGDKGDKADNRTPVCRKPQSINSFNYNTSDILEDNNADLEEYQINNILKEVSAKARGTIPAGVDAILQEIMKEPVIRWQDVLKQYIGRLPIPFKKTNTRLNRRQPFRLDIMGKLPDNYYRIVIAIDTSGSMSDNDISMCMNEIWGIINYQKKRFDVTVITCDSKVQEVFTVKKRADFNKIHIKGRGGTAFSPVYEYLRENRRKYKDAVVIYFTDGYGESRLTVQPLNYNNIWVITQHINDLSLNKPYGRVLTMNIDELHKKYKK